MPTFVVLAVYVTHATVSAALKPHVAPEAWLMCAQQLDMCTAPGGGPL